MCKGIERFVTRTTKSHYIGEPMAIKVWQDFWKLAKFTCAELHDAICVKFASLFTIYPFTTDMLLKVLESVTNPEPMQLFDVLKVFGSILDARVLLVLSKNFGST